MGLVCSAPAVISSPPVPHWVQSALHQQHPRSISWVVQMEEGTKLLLSLTVVLPWTMQTDISAFPDTHSKN